VSVSRTLRPPTSTLFPYTTLFRSLRVPLDRERRSGDATLRARGRRAAAGVVARGRREGVRPAGRRRRVERRGRSLSPVGARVARSEEHTSELQSLAYLVCRLLLEK